MVMQTIYPHQPVVSRVTPFSDPLGKAVAGVTLVYGPLVIRAKLMNGEKGLFLSMPSRKNETTQAWWEHAYIQDRTLLEVFEKMAIHQYLEESVKEAVLAAA